jgi:GntR family transcriptional regulator/MocR family aminotransferase
MRTYTLTRQRRQPLYAELYRQIREDILSGALAEGEKLPSKRALAEHLQVSVTTVEGAYAQLMAEGYVHTLPKRGFFVSRVDRPLAPAPADALPVERPTPNWVLDLRSNRISPARFPLSAWARLTRQVLSREGTALLSPLPHQGLPELRQAIAEDLREYRGMRVSPAQIVIGAGAEYLYLLLAQLLGSQGPFALEDPGYPKIARIYGRCGISCVQLPLDREGLPPDALRASGAKVAHLSPSHQYPTGLITPIGRRQALLRWAEEVDGWLIEDDYDSEFRFSGRPLPTLQSIDRQGRVIYLNTFSQTIAPSVRVGYMVLPPRLLERYLRELDFYACPVPGLDQAVLARFISGGFYERHLSRMRTEYRLLRAQVLEAFRASPFAGRIRISEQGAGLHFLLRLDTARSDEELSRRAAELGVRLGFLSEYAARPDPDFAHTLVINYGGLQSEDLDRTIGLLSQILE